MNKFKQAVYGAASSALLLAPALAKAQWDVGLGNAESSNTPGGRIYEIINVAMKWLLGILGFLAIIGFVIAGILYLTAAGSESQLEKAKNALVYSIIGVIVAILGYVIVQAVDTWLRTDSTTF